MLLTLLRFFPVAIHIKRAVCVSLTLVLRIATCPHNSLIPQLQPLPQKNLSPAQSLAHHMPFSLTTSNAKNQSTLRTR
jgi:hypothetical protein